MLILSHSLLPLSFIQPLTFTGCKPRFITFGLSQAVNSLLEIWSFKTSSHRFLSVFICYKLRREGTVGTKAVHHSIVSHLKDFQSAAITDQFHCRHLASPWSLAAMREGQKERCECLELRDCPNPLWSTCIRHQEACDCRADEALCTLQIWNPLYRPCHLRQYLNNILDSRFGRCFKIGTYSQNIHTFTPISQPFFKSEWK